MRTRSAKVVMKRVACFSKRTEMEMMLWLWFLCVFTVNIDGLANLLFPCFVWNTHCYKGVEYEYQIKYHVQRKQQFSSLLDDERLSYHSCNCWRFVEEEIGRFCGILEFVALEGKESIAVGLLYKIHFVCRLPIWKWKIRTCTGNEVYSK